MTDRAVRRPSVLILAMLMVLSGVLNLGASILLLATPVVAASSGVPGWAIYLNLVLAILLFVATALVMMFKRAGLLLGLVVYVIIIVTAIISVISGQSIQGVIPGIVLAVIGLIVLSRYLTSEPQKSAFA
jgi:hypothetical protein